MLLVIILLIALPAGIYLTDKTQIFNPKATETKPTQVIEKLTSDLINANKDYGRPGVASVDKEKQLVEMTSIASQRKEKLLQEIESDPASFLRHTVLTKTKSQFPTEIQGLIENKLEVQGKLTFLHADDFDNKESKTTYKLEISDSKAKIHSIDSAMTSKNTYNLHFVQNLRGLLPNSIIRIQGISLDHEVALPDNQPPFINIVSQGAIQTVQDVKIAVILFKFQNTLAEPFTADAVHETLFIGSNSIKNFYNENSFGQLNIDSEASDIFGWYTVSYNISGGSSCAFEDWSYYAAQQARNAGVDLNSYTHKIFVFPQVASCAWGGMAYVQGNEVWINGRKDPYVFAHELGHNFGAKHANSLSCGSAAISSYGSCQETEYGDPYDVMGLPSSYNYTYHFNAPHKREATWISQAAVQSVTQAGSYTIDSLEASSSGIKALRIPKTDTSESYYVSYRRPVGFDSSIQEIGTRGVSIHIWKEAPLVKTRIIDLTPGSSDGFRDATLADGNYFYDSINNIRVTQNSHTDSSAVVEVAFSPPPRNSFIGNWTTLSFLPRGSYFHTLISSNGYLFNIGGEGTPSENVYAARVNTDGTISSWTASTSLPIRLSRHATVSYNNRIFVSGGYSQDLGVSHSTNVYSTTVNTDGTIGSWTTLTPLPKGFWYHSMVAYNDYLFVVGGYSSDYLVEDTVYSAKINSDGSLGSWTSTTSLPKKLYNHATVVVNGHLFVIGGNDDSLWYIDGTQSAVYSAQINNDGTLGSWTTNISLPVKLADHSTVTYGDYLFVLGGSKWGSGAQSNTYSTRVNSDGTIDAWVMDTALPHALYYHSSTASNGFVFVFGGMDGTANPPQQAVYSAPLRVSLSPSPSPTPFPTPSPTPTSIPQQTLQFNIGWNLVGLAVDKGVTYKASDFARELNTALGEGSVTHIIDWNGRYVVYTVGQDVNDFSIIPGKGYFVRSTRSGSTTISGNQPSISSMAIPTGWSMVSFPRALTGITNAGELLQAMQDQGVDARMLAKWSGGRWTIYNFDVGANNFPITPGEGYFVRNFGDAKTFTLQQ